MKNNLFLAVLVLIAADVFALSTSVNPPIGSTIQITAEPGTTKQIEFSITNTGWGGILVFYSTNLNPQWQLLTPNCVVPNTAGKGYASIQISGEGQQTITLNLLLMDFWNALQGDTCATVSPKDYATASTKSYSTGTGTRNVVIYSGCQYGSPLCNQNQDCINNKCVLKPGCQYNNPPCSASQDCINNQCFLKQGCLYNNPSCDSIHDCINNQCILKPGCQYNNPPCGLGFSCFDNTCIEVLSSEKVNQINSKLNTVKTKIVALREKVARLVSLFEQSGDFSTAEHWKRINQMLENFLAKAEQTSAHNSPAPDAGRGAGRGGGGCAWKGHRLV